MKRTLFLAFSGAILIFAIISICCAPIINGDIIGAGSWKTNNCKLKEDAYKLAKTDDNKRAKNKCNRQKAMYGLEYSSLIIDVVLGFICTILGLLHYFDVAKPFEKISGIIGLSTGIIGFILTLVYICYSGYIFTHDITEGFDDNKIQITILTETFTLPLLKLDKEGAFAEWDDSKNQYKCIFYKSNKPNSIYAKYNDLGKRQYNYEKKRHYDADDKYNNCKETLNSFPCVNEYFSSSGHSGNNCKKLYLDTYPSGVDNKYVFDRWVSTIIFSCFIAACCIGLAIFGFLLFKSDGSGL
jgi:hypothetical protein